MPPAVFSRWILLRLQLFSQKRRRLRKEVSLNSTKRLTSLTELSRTRSGWARSRRILDRTMIQVCIFAGLQIDPTKAPIAALLKLRERVKFLLSWVHHILAGFENRPGNTQLVHLVDQGGALQAKFGGSAFRTAYYPTHAFKSPENQSAFVIS